MKKKVMLMCIAGILACTAVIGGTLAGFHTEARQQGVAQITTKSLSIELQEKVSAEEAASAENAGPGDEIALVRNIVNDAEDGYELYTRVTIYKSWNRDDLDSSKLRLYRDGVELVTENAEAVNDSDWILWYADDEQVVMYYRKPLAVGECTSDILSSVQIDVDINNQYVNSKFAVEFEVDAVQKIAADQAIISEWGVYPVFDENGNITSISE